MKTDILVIGSGIAGLAFALHASDRHPERKITILSKAASGETNTRYAQGGIAVPLNDHDIQEHIRDTLRAGDGLCNRKIVELVVSQARERINELEKWGMRFDKNENREFEYGREGGHTVNRIVHSLDSTGLDAENALLKMVRTGKNIRIISYCHAADLIVKSSQQSITRECAGAWVLLPGTVSIQPVLSSVTILASGGIGQVYARSTNPSIATGDGIAMAVRAGVRSSNMEFIQFHPTALYQQGETTLFLISEAVRGEGAILRAADGKRFMFDYDMRGELASRDIVSRAIVHEMHRTGSEFVWLDCTHFESGLFEKKFPNIASKCRAIHIDPRKDMIPVVPAAHYCCGGISSDENGRTSLEGLYAIGECADTGLHGANRLASNSLLEALVFAKLASDAVRFDGSNGGIIQLPAQKPASARPVRPAAAVRSEIQAVMSRYAGVFRSQVSLLSAKRQLKALQRSADQIYSSSLTPESIELRNLAAVSLQIIEASLKRHRNQGVFYKAGSMENPDQDAMGIQSDLRSSGQSDHFQTK
jgi:L-aspartate oxidase